EQAARRSLKLVDRGPLAARATTLLATVHFARHEFGEALRGAQAAMELNPGDPIPNAVAGDALLEMGKYDEAAQAYARLAALQGLRRPDARMAWLKFLQGDAVGAVADMRQAVTHIARRNPSGEPVAWMHYQLGELLFYQGDLAGAEAAERDALTAMPNYHRALAGAARVQAAGGRLREAADLYHKALNVIPLPEYAAALGDVYTRLGRAQEAAKQYALVEYIGRLSALNKVVYNRELALFYADHDMKLPEALELARREVDARRDIYTQDVLAWALLKNGRAREAEAAIQEALKLGTPDPRLFFHAGMIYRALGDADRAREALRRALTLNPHFHVLQAEVATRALGELQAQR
ncbi:MAG TPA: tetratricopeptide repeat protein, partial [Methylomirabilota bacterium]|nr:tetratricopeptide repeat protein [Methylomirabilota bacterium]